MAIYHSRKYALNHKQIQEMLLCTFSVVPSLSQNLSVVARILIRGRGDLAKMKGNWSETTKNSNWKPFCGQNHEKSTVCLNLSQFFSLKSSSPTPSFRIFEESIANDESHPKKNIQETPLISPAQASPGSSFCALSPKARWDRVLSFEGNDSTAARDACDRSDLGLTPRPRANLGEPPQIDKWKIK